MTRILLVNAEGTAALLGGAETIVAMLALGLARRGWEVEVLAAFPAPGQVAVDRLVTIHRTSWRSSRRRRVLNRIEDLVGGPTPRVSKAVRAARPDVVHTHNLPGLTTSVWAAAKAEGARVVHTLHDYYLLCPRVTLVSPRGRVCGRGLYCTFRSRRLGVSSDAVDAVVGVSNSLLASHAGFFPRATEHVIRHPWSPADGSVRPASSPPRTIGFLGNLDVTKGVHVLLDAAPRLADLGYDVHIAGDGRLRSAVETAAMRVATIRYAGRVSPAERRSFLADCDIGIVPSVWNEPGGPPLALLDWLSAGRPVLSSGRGGLAEIAGARGVVQVEPTADALVRAAAALRDEQAWAELCGAIQPPVLPTEEEWLDVYESVLTGRTGAGSG